MKNFAFLNLLLFAFASPAFAEETPVYKVLGDNIKQPSKHYVVTEDSDLQSEQYYDDFNYELDAFYGSSQSPAFNSNLDMNPSEANNGASAN